MDGRILGMEIIVRFANGVDAKATRLATQFVTSN